MQPFTALPFRAKNTVEHFLLHPVLRLDAQNVAYPYGANIDGKVTEYQSAHHGHSPIETAFHHMGSHVDGMLYRPHLGEAHNHAQ